MSIRAVLFDADGVVQFRGDLGTHFASQHGWSEQELEELGRELFGDAEFDTACLTGAADWTVHVDGVLRRRRWPGTTESFLEVWFRHGTLVSEAALGLVADLRRQGVLCALATNQEARRARFMENDLGFGRCFDRLLFSCRLGTRKPDHAFFRGALADLGVAPHEALFIDDSEPNVVAARECGMAAERFSAGDDLNHLVARHLRRR